MISTRWLGEITLSQRQALIPSWTPLAIRAQSVLSGSAASLAEWRKTRVRVRREQMLGDVGQDRQIETLPRKRLVESIRSGGVARLSRIPPR
jgi:hypothetical protein